MSDTDKHVRYLLWCISQWPAWAALVQITPVQIRDQQVVLWWRHRIGLYNSWDWALLVNLEQCQSTHSALTPSAPAQYAHTAKCSSGTHANWLGVICIILEYTNECILTVWEPHLHLGWSACWVCPCEYTVLEHFPYKEGQEALDQSVATPKELGLQIAPYDTSCWYC